MSLPVIVLPTPDMIRTPLCVFEAIRFGTPPPIVVSLPATCTPFRPFGIGLLPSRVVPITLPCTNCLFDLLMLTPLPVLPEIMLPPPEVPTWFGTVQLRRRMPLALGRGAVPAAVVPTRLP